jgi:hypothetical protein
MKSSAMLPPVGSAPRTVPAARDVADRMARRRRNGTVSEIVGSAWRTRFTGPHRWNWLYSRSPRERVRQGGPYKPMAFAAGSDRPT